MLSKWCEKITVLPGSCSQNGAKKITVLLGSCSQDDAKNNGFPNVYIIALYAPKRN